MKVLMVQMNNNFNVLVTGANGLLGSYLIKELEKQNIPYVGFSKLELDITNQEMIFNKVNEFSPTHIINCAAYTNVAQAELDREVCYAVNVEGVKNLITIANKNKVKLINISSDFVFDGHKKSGYYYEFDIPNPLNYYGLTKYQAEQEISKRCKSWVIIRTSWVYGLVGNNFVNKILELSKKQSIISVTDQEIGSPTYAYDLAVQLVLLIRNQSKGIQHITNSGHISRYEFAKKIIELSGSGCEIVINKALNSKKVDRTLEVKRPSKVILKSRKPPINNREWESALIEFLKVDKQNEGY